LEDALNSHATGVARAFVPGHITGLFRIFDEQENPLYCGSTGAGFCVAIGTSTTVKVVDHTRPEISTKYNGRDVDARVTRAVVQRLTREYGRTLRVEIEHESDLPIGAGFGASGAGALGTALALGSLLDSSIDTEWAASFAHHAEVENHTGLGDVIAQTKGGTEIRVRPGAPGIGVVTDYPIDASLDVVLAGAPGLETSEVLTNPDRRTRINVAGDGLVSALVENPTFGSFIRCARKFAERIGLETDRVASALLDLDKEGLANSSMVMLGDSVFCFCDSSDTPTATGIVRRYYDRSEVFVTQVSELGGRLVS
jgi:pantoate kinase